MNENTELTKTEGQEVEHYKAARMVTPKVDIYESEEEVLLIGDLPGVEKNTLNISVEKNVLTLEGLRVVELPQKDPVELTYQRAFTLPRSIDQTKISAELSDGVLKLHLPKAEELKPREIPISVQ